MSFASVQEVKNLAENWCYENLIIQANHHHVQVVEMAVRAYTAGYDQALEDLRSELR